MNRNTGLRIIVMLRDKQKILENESFQGFLAEKEGFEPSIRFCRIRDFQSRALDQARRLLHIKLSNALLVNERYYSTVYQKLQYLWETFYTQSDK